MIYGERYNFQVNRNVLSMRKYNIRIRITDETSGKYFSGAKTGLESN